MSTFLALELLLFCFYVFTIIHVEIKSKKKSILWRIILPTAGVACLSKAARLAVLADPHTRFKVGEVVLLFLYNTHLCMATISYITLLFFWMRLKHDLVANQRIFGKLKPGYIAAVTITVIFYYAQVLAKGILAHPDFVMYVLMFGNGLVCFSLAVVFLCYTVAIWKPYLSQQNTTTLFYKTFIGATISSIIVIGFCIELVISNTTPFNATWQYLIKHAIYESLFLFQLIGILSGFVVHYFQYYASNIRPRASDQSLEKATSDLDLTSIPSFTFSSSRALSRSANSLCVTQTTSPRTSDHILTKTTSELDEDLTAIPSFTFSSFRAANSLYATHATSARTSNQSLTKATSDEDLTAIPWFTFSSFRAANATNTTSARTSDQSLEKATSDLNLTSIPSFTWSSSRALSLSTNSLCVTRTTSVTISETTLQVE
eukprot:Phypoly_transcript_10009.p1 GENE.Phypoly_transcript_10009~~Phypoly_transcript_10009.p1  ORF type:complete len:444 (+),score=48.18 Phypoly_transcript_10009:41-1333(+)